MILLYNQLKHTRKKEVSMYKMKVLGMALLLGTSVNTLANTAELVENYDDNNAVIKGMVYQKELAWILAPINTRDALDRISEEKSPLDLLSPPAKERFIDSIVFRETGLGGFDFSDLEAELTPTQIHKILSMFGAQHAVHLFTKARIETRADVLLLSNPTQ